MQVWSTFIFWRCTFKVSCIVDFHQKIVLLYNNCYSRIFTSLLSRSTRMWLLSHSDLMHFGQRIKGWSRLASLPILWNTLIQIQAFHNLHTTADKQQHMETPRIRCETQHTPIVYPRCTRDQQHHHRLSWIALESRYFVLSISNWSDLIRELCTFINVNTPKIVTIGRGCYPKCKLS